MLRSAAPPQHDEKGDAPQSFCGPQGAQNLDQAFVWTLAVLCWFCHVKRWDAYRAVLVLPR